MVLNVLKKIAGVVCALIIILSFAGWYIHGECGLIINTLGAIVTSGLSILVTAVAWIVSMLLLRVVIWLAMVTTWLPERRAEFLDKKICEFLPDFE